MPKTEGHEFEFQNVQNKHESCSQYSYTFKGLFNPLHFRRVKFAVMLTYPFQRGGNKIFNCYLQCSHFKVLRLVEADPDGGDHEAEGLITPACA